MMGRFLGGRAEGLALVVFTAIVWGASWPQAKFLLSLLPPFTFRTMTGFGGCLLAFAVAAMRGDRLVPTRSELLHLLILAMLNYGLFVILTTTTLTWMPASEAIIVTYTLPIWSALLAWPILGERITLIRVVAIVLGCSGVALMAGVGSVHIGTEKLPGVGLALLAAWVFGLGAVLSKKHPIEMPQLVIVAWQCGLGTIPVALLATQEHPVWARMDASAWGLIFYMAAMPMTVAYLAWFRCLKLIPTATATTFILLSPIVGVTVATLWLGDQLGPRHYIALAATLSGVLLAARR